MKILCMPDAHLKVELIECIDKLLEQHPDWHCVSLGDWADDWGRTPSDYQNFFDALLGFNNKYFGRVSLCWGNHDFGYWIKPGSHSGYMADSKDIVRSAIAKLDNQDYPNILVAIGWNKTIFSHAGISADFFKQGCEWWKDHLGFSFWSFLQDLENPDLHTVNSPLWYRPSNNPHKNTFNPSYLQVVGHTPVATITYDKESNTLYTDTWSTDSKRTPLGDKSLVVVDTKTQEWEIIPYE